MTTENFTSFKTKKPKLTQTKSFAPPTDADGASVVIDTPNIQGGVNAGGFFGTYVDIEGSARTESELIKKYREIAAYPECDMAIEDIVNEAISDLENEKLVSVDLSEVRISETLKKKIHTEWDGVTKLLNFETAGHNTFKRWYIDGRIYFHKIVDENNQAAGIKELRYLDPRKMKKIITVSKENSKHGATVYGKTSEFFVYANSDAQKSTQFQFQGANATRGIKIPAEEIAYCTSGEIDYDQNLVLSYLHKAMKIVNQVRMMEDALVIYRMSRAPERRIFYVDTGNMPKLQAEAHVKNLMTTYRNKTVYDACLSMDTKVPLLDGRVLTIREMQVEHEAGKVMWVYSCDPITGKFAPGLVSSAGITKFNQKVIRLTLDNGEIITCTYDHKFPVWNKGKVEAQNLIVGDSMIPKDSEIKDHKITNIEFLDETMDVGTLGIDKEEIYHNYHTFALDSGIYTCNSTGQVRDDRKFSAMIEDFWIPRQNGSNSTEIDTLPGGCLAMDTKVDLLDGRSLSIKEIEAEMANGKTLWTYSIDHATGKIKPGLITWAGVTQKSAKVMKLTFDNGESLICTPDHKFPIYKNGFVEARDLSIGTSMMPHYTRKEPLSDKTTNTYTQFFDVEKKNWEFTHRLVADDLHGSYVFDYVYDKDSSKKYVRHHIDHNRYNNDPSNLCFMSWNDHKKYHSDKGFSREDVLKGTIAAAAKIAYMKEHDKEAYAQLQEMTSKNFTKWWASLNPVEKTKQVDKIKNGQTEYWNNISPELKLHRAMVSATNAKLGYASLQNKLKNPLYKEEFYKKVSAGWTADIREAAKIRMIDRNNIRWNDPELSVIARKNHKDNQKLVIDQYILDSIISITKGKTTHQFTKDDVISVLNNNDDLVSRFLNLNSGKCVPNWKPEDKFSRNMLNGFAKQFGYDNWKKFRKFSEFHNHKLVGIEYLDQEIPVGTLTIDNEELVHDYHTFALSIGIYTKNSNLSDIDDILYFQKNLYKALNVPVSRLSAETNIVAFGKQSEVNRDELKFSKFVSRLRRKFSELFADILKTQLILKNIFTEQDWNAISDDIKFIYSQDSYYAEAKETEILRNRIEILSEIEPYVGIFFDKEYVFKKILRMTDEEIRERIEGINKDASEGFFGILPERKKQEAIGQMAAESMAQETQENQAASQPSSPTTKKNSAPATAEPPLVQDQP